MTAVPLNKTTPAQDDPPPMPYYLTAAFQNALRDVPFKQKDASGDLVVNIAYFFYKVVQGQVVGALVPEDFSIPSVWEPVASDDPRYEKALSMLGLT